MTLTFFQPRTTTTSRRWQNVTREKKSEKMIDKKQPIFYKIRSSLLFLEICVGLGLFVDISIYGLMIPAIPFRLQQIGYGNSSSESSSSSSSKSTVGSVSSRTGLLVACYSLGLLISSIPFALLGEHSTSSSNSSFSNRWKFWRRRRRRRTNLFNKTINEDEDDNSQVTYGNNVVTTTTTTTTTTNIDENKKSTLTKKPKRQLPLIGSLVFLMAATTMFMVVDTFSGLVVARILQGIAGTGIWTLGLAMISDAVAEDKIGEVLGYVMSAFALGTVTSYPVGGALFQNLGFRAPSVYAMILIFFDLVMRILVIEKSKEERDAEELERQKDRSEPVSNSSSSTPEQSTQENEVSNQHATSPEEDVETNLEEDTDGFSKTTETEFAERNKTTDQVEAEEIKEAADIIAPPPPSATRSSAMPSDRSSLVPVPSRSSVIAPPPNTAPSTFTTSTHHPKQKCVTPRALIRLFASPRTATLFAISTLFGLIFGGLLDSAMTLHVIDIYGLNSLGAGLVFLGIVVPMLVAGPISGKLSDMYGARIIETATLSLTTPALALLMIKVNLAGFVALVCLVGLASSCIGAPLMQDLSDCVTVTAGLGYAHVYGMFNFGYSIGTLDYYFESSSITF